MNQPTRPAETVSSERLLAEPNPRLDAAEDVLWAARKYGHWLEAQWGKAPNDMAAGEYETVRERLCNAAIKYASMCPANDPDKRTDSAEDGQ